MKNKLIKLLSKLFAPIVNEIVKIQLNEYKVKLDNKLEYEVNKLRIQTERSFDSTINSIGDKFDEIRPKIDTLTNVLDSMDISVDVHEYSPSWAVISLQGKKVDYVKFVELGDVDIREISQFLRRFEKNSNVKIDAYPQFRNMIKSDIKY